VYKYIPAAVTTAFNDIANNIGLRYFSLVILPNVPKVGAINLSIGTNGPWNIVPGIIELKNLLLEIEFVDPSEDPVNIISLSASANVLPALFKGGDFSFLAGFQETDSGWEVDLIQGRYPGIVTLRDIVDTLGAGKDMIPGPLKDVIFSDFGISVDYVNQRYTCFGTCAFCFPLLGTEVSSTISVNIEQTDTGHSVVLHGILSIGKQNFNFHLNFSKDQGTKNTTLSATWKAQDESSYLQLEDLISAFGFGTPSIPQTVNLTLKEATLDYDFAADTMAIHIVSAHYGSATFVTKKLDNAYAYVFGMRMVLENIGLDSLPVIGADLKSVVGDVSLKDIQLLISNTDLDKNQVTIFNGLAGQDATFIPETGDGLPAGVHAALQLAMGKSNTYRLMVAPGTKKQACQRALRPERVALTYRGSTCSDRSGRYTSAKPVRPMKAASSTSCSTHPWYFPH